jgi:hypothetical protein
MQSSAHALSAAAEPDQRLPRFDDVAGPMDRWSFHLIILTVAGLLLSPFFAGVARRLTFILGG